MVGAGLPTALRAHFTPARLDPDLQWVDVFGVAVLAGIGFTVSLLIGELANGSGRLRDEHSTIGVLVGSLLAGVLASIILRRRYRHYRLPAGAEAVDEDRDGVPDVHR